MKSHEEHKTTLLLDIARTIAVIETLANMKFIKWDIYRNHPLHYEDYQFWDTRDLNSFFEYNEFENIAEVEEENYFYGKQPKDKADERVRRNKYKDLGMATWKKKGPKF